MSYDIISAQSYHETTKVVSPHVLFRCCLTLFLQRGNPMRLSKVECATRHLLKRRRLRAQSLRSRLGQSRNRAPELSAATSRPTQWPPRQTVFAHSQLATASPRCATG